MLSWCWLLVVGRSKIWTLAGAMYRLSFHDVVRRGGLALLALLPLLPGIGAWAGVCCKLVYFIWGLCCGLCGGLNGPIGSSLLGEGFELVSLQPWCALLACWVLMLLDLRPRQFGPTPGSGFVQFVGEVIWRFGLLRTSNGLSGLSKIRFLPWHDLVLRLYIFFLFCIGSAAHASVITHIDIKHGENSCCWCRGGGAVTAV